MPSFNLLSKQIQKYVYNSGWESFRPIQEAAIDYIINTDGNYILSAATASGKTEAAFLPILSTCYPKGYQEVSGIKILYISPLVALINDQFKRVEDLCKYLNIKITKWHGEASRSEKKNLVNLPEGVVLITPESIEAMFCNNPQNVKRLFGSLDFVIVDEIHSFIGTERGVHLQSLLYRIQEINLEKVRFIGLSATLGDYDLAKNFFGNPQKTKVLKDSKTNIINAEFKFYENKSAEISPLIIEDLYKENANSKSLIFPNSRGRVEEISVKLKKKTKQEKSYHRYFAHHSSVEKDIREWAENFAKTNVKEDFSIVCTSTLELGIDIGSVDKIIQIGDVISVNSLAQRLGRAGRKTGVSNLVVYSLKQWQLLQNIASFELLKAGFLESGKTVKRFDILTHQILSILKETSGFLRGDLVEKVCDNWAFILIKKEEVEFIIDYLIKIKLIEDLKKELILGINSQYLVTSKDFYALFEAKKGFKVLYNGKGVGEIDPPYFEDIPSLVGENIFLAAQIWKITDFDILKKKFFVQKANDGKPPKFSDNGGFNIDSKIREKTLEILFSNKIFEYIDDKSVSELQDLRNQFGLFKEFIFDGKALIIGKGLKTEVWLFTSTKIQNTLRNIVKFLDKDLLDSSDNPLCFVFKMEKNKTMEFLNNLKNQEVNYNELITKIFQEEFEGKPEFTKWSRFLPLKFQIELYKKMFFDVEGLEKLVS